MTPQTHKLLLLELEWPRSHLDHRGTLSWSRALDATTIASAAVVVTQKLLTLRYRLMAIHKGVSTPLEAKWSLDGGLYAEFQSLRENGVHRPLDEQRALIQFRGFTKLLGGEPTFQDHGRREAAFDLSFPNI